MDTGQKSFLGSGWSFPPAFDRIRNGVWFSDGIRDIEESIRIILGTIPGERIMQPSFGCGIHRLVFEGMGQELLSKFVHEIGTALLEFEPRVKFHDVEIAALNKEENILFLRIQYSIIITNTRHNIVYPFYLYEGTQLSLQVPEVAQ